MKNLQKLFSMTLLVCMAVAMFSCSKDDEEVSYTQDDLIGNWSVLSSEMATIGGGTDVATPTYPENSVFMISADSKYSIMTEAADFSYQSGTWKLEEGKTVVITENALKTTKRFEIKSLNKESATLYYKHTVKVLDSEVGYSETVILKK